MALAKRSSALQFRGNEGAVGPNARLSIRHDRVWFEIRFALPYTLFE